MTLTEAWIKDFLAALPEQPRYPSGEHKYREVAVADLAALAALALRALEMQWRPISEAPRDGTAIDLWVVDGAASYRLTDCQWLSDYGETGWASWRQYAEALHDSGFQILEDDKVVTHWMPLPTPAEERGDG